MKYYITTAIDYINGKPHIGHSYEKVAADVLARWHRLKGEQVFFLTGTDEHGAKIAEFAAKQDQQPQAFADENFQNFKLAWDNLGLSYDRFIRTTDKDHLKAVETILKKIKESGHLYEGEYTGMYCVGHEAFLTEKDLVDGLCPEHGTKPEIITEKNWFFKVSSFTAQIKEAIVSGTFKIWPEERKNEILSLLDQGFNDIAISRPNVQWGIPLPWDKKQTVYVWVDALINYISGVGYVGDKELFKKFWPADWHVVGKDIIKFHCIIWPAMLLAAGLDIPKGVVGHGYLTAGNKKISKSIGNVIDPNEWVSKYGSDAVRYFLMREISFGQDGDVSEEKLQSRYEGDLANGLGNLVSRLTNMIEKYCHGEVPHTVSPEMNLSEIDLLLENFKFHEALQKIWEAIAWSNQYIDETKPWQVAKDNQEEVEAILSKLAAEVQVIGYFLAPFMPDTAEKIRLAFESDTITKIEPLFPRIEEEVLPSILL
ncbi:MAG: methionyl-tRNA synthetase [Candidatus Doudnabacteria bacterium]|nr:methionyl-tRNA synthetase [Candidatus Doudnabacteria bacterium]